MTSRAYKILCAVLLLSFAAYQFHSAYIMGEVTNAMKIKREADDIQNKADAAKSYAEAVKNKQIIIPSPLMLAAQGGDIEEINRLIERGAAIEERDWTGNTALDYALGTKDWNKPIQIPAAKALLAHGANFNIRPSDYGRTHLMHAIGKIQAVQLLLEAGADVNVISKDGHSALFYAKIGGRSDVAALLKAHGANTLGVGE